MVLSVIEDWLNACSGCEISILNIGDPLVDLLAGTMRLQYPPNVRIVRVMCSGMVHPSLVIDAFTSGASGVMICGCHPGDCHYMTGNAHVADRAEAIKLLLEDFGLEPERFRLAWVSASEGPQLAEVMTEMTEVVRGLPPSPYALAAHPLPVGSLVAESGSPEA